MRPSPSAHDLALLGFSPDDDPSAAQVEAAWRELRSAAHPDKGGDASLFADLNMSYLACLAWAERARPCHRCGGSGKVGVFRCNECAGAGFN